jgi:hypothetical protein
MKEDEEGIPFHTLLTAGTHRGDRILRRKLWWRFVLAADSSVRSGRRWSGARAMQEEARRRRVLQA